MRGLRGLGVFLFVAGCAAGDASVGFERVDSAGVWIARSSAPAWEERGGFTVDPAPIVEIGVAEGEEAYQLFRVFSAVRMPDGRILVGNAGSQEVRVYDEAGRHIQSVGRVGAGPAEFGEFSSLRICLTPDGFLVEDGANDRANVFGSDLSFRTILKPEALPGTRPPSVIGCFKDGSLLTWTPAGTGALQGADGEILRSTSHYHRQLGDGSYDVRLAEVPTQPRVVNQVGQVTNYPFIPLTAAPVVAPGTARLYVGADDGGSIDVRALDGTLAGRIEWPARGRHARTEIWDRFVSEALADMDEDRRPQYARLYEREMPVPDSTPAYRALLEDARGHLWVERYRLPWETARVWEVFEPDGRWLGSVEMPAGLTVFQIGDDFVLGRHLDELGIERVRVHPLAR